MQGLTLPNVDFRIDPINCFRSLEEQILGFLPYIGTYLRLSQLSDDEDLSFTFELAVEKDSPD